LSGTVLFSNYISLVEGDVEPIVIPPLLSKLMESGRRAKDLNSLSVIGMGNSRDGDALLRILTSSSSKLMVGVLVDGDDGGKDLLKALKPMLVSRDIPSATLEPGRTIGDYLISPEHLWVEAVLQYSNKYSVDHGTGELDLDAERPLWQQSFTQRDKK
jgi:hypothetical protein